MTFVSWRKGYAIMAINPLKSSAIARQAAAICDAPADIIDQAYEIIREVQYRKLPASSSVVASMGFSLPFKICTTAIDTMAVSIGSDGTYVFLYNPHYTVKLNETAHGALFVVWHEIGGHILNLDCLVGGPLKSDEDFTMATEARINWTAKRVLGCPMPMIDGKVTGIDPVQVLKDVNADRRKKGLAVITEEVMYKTVMDAYDYIKAMDKPPKQTMQFCSHCEGEGEGEGGGEPGDGKPEPGTGTVAFPLDREAADKIGKQLLTDAINAAINNGDDRARAEINVLMDVSQGNEAMTQLWGSIGADRLRGVEVATQRTDLWKNWTANAVGTRLQDGDRWVYAEKIGAVAMALHLPVPIRPRGKIDLKSGAVFTDVSGSMSRAFHDELDPLLTETPNLEVKFFDFDCYVAEVDKQLRDGGGTNFSCIEDYVNDMDDEPDFVLVITDGYAPHIQPKNAERWIWMIVPGGDEWPEAAGMSCRLLDMEDLRK